MTRLLFGACALACFAEYTFALGYNSFYDGPPTLRFLEREKTLNADGEQKPSHVETSPGVPPSVTGGSMMAPSTSQENSGPLMPSILNAQFGQNTAQMQQPHLQNTQGFPAQIPSAVPQIHQENYPTPQVVQNSQPLEHSPALQTAITTEQLETQTVDQSQNLRGGTNGKKDPLYESLQGLESQLSNALGAVKEKLESIQEMNKRPIHVDCGVTRVRFVCPKDKKKKKEDNEESEEDDDDEDEKDEGEDEDE
ncbi:membrane protein, hypothetical [Theileria equi strain WA]|uniref:Membrane protein, hypothetical n=1 Tax=Theileria equi strain WA TaxID=1537102 RepID=L1LCL7_THEEQ|nr:membrane protein, hypothetical [Theileria equi strain WA]EKX73024.1 membrane protein, hypothetical [Theileria equi strain WA]|eukprot:XP_004832476.1 membrane protein, hypothetical [Theileria equi strain WA]